MKCIEGEYIGDATFICSEEELSGSGIGSNVVIISQAEWNNHIEFLREIQEWMNDNDYECGSHGGEIYERLGKIC